MYATHEVGLGLFRVKICLFIYQSNFNFYVINLNMYIVKFCLLVGVCQQ